MDLRELGFEDWFREKQEDLLRLEYRVARVTAVDRASYLVRNENGEVPAELAGKLTFSAESSIDLPCVGDWVFVQYHNSDTLAIIHALFPRRSELRRKTPGKKIDYQMIASNIDVAFIVQSCDTNFNVRRLERYLAMVVEGAIEPVVLLSKTDLINPHELEQMISEIRQAGISERIFAFSNENGLGLDHVRQALVKGKTFCLLGIIRSGQDHTPKPSHGHRGIRDEPRPRGRQQRKTHDNASSFDRPRQRCDGDRQSGNAGVGYDGCACGDRRELL